MYHSSLKKRLFNGARRMMQWFSFTVTLSGIPLMLYIMLSWIYGENEQLGLTEFAAFVVGITAPVFMENHISGYIYVKAPYGFIKLIFLLSFILFCLIYGHVYITGFNGGELRFEELAEYKLLELIFGGCCIGIAAVFQFFGGFYAE